MSAWLDDSVAVIGAERLDYFAVHRPAVFVLHLADDLARLHVDDVAGRDIRQVPIEADRDPIWARGRFDARSELDLSTQPSRSILASSRAQSRDPVASRATLAGVPRLRSG